METQKISSARVLRLVNEISQLYAFYYANGGPRPVAVHRSDYEGLSERGLVVVDRKGAASIGGMPIYPTDQ